MSNCECEVCGHQIKFDGIEEIPEGNDPETGEEIIEIYRCSSCEHCGALYHTLIAIKPRVDREGDKDD